MSHNRFSDPRRRLRKALVRLVLLSLIGLSCQSANAESPSQPASLSAIGAVLQSALTDGKVSGIVALVGHAGHIDYRHAVGTSDSGLQKIDPAAILDAGGLTRSVVTATAIMQLFEAGKLQLDVPVSRYWPAFANGGKEGVTVRQLLTQTSGFADAGERADAGSVLSQRLIATPGTRVLDSDLNFIALGALVEKVSGLSLDSYAAQKIFAPLAMKNSSFAAASGARTDKITIAGNRGLFSTADDLGRFATALLQGGSLDGVSILQPKTVALMSFGAEGPDGVRRGLGWGLMQQGAKVNDTGFSPRTFGATGKTGAALWLDPETKGFFVILTSPGKQADMAAASSLQQEVAKLVGAAYRPKVLAGIDNLADQFYAPLAGKRVALLANSAQHGLAGDRTIDIITNAPAVDLKAYFAPEHGFEAAANSEIASGTDSKTQLPIFSLYGKTQRPTPDMLANIDVIVVDLQDVGVRYYTYITTVGYLLEEAAGHPLEIMLLDRPNPINPAVVAGPLMDAELKSFIGYYPLPLRHGMTLGEMAMMFNAESHIGAKLTVIPLLGYQRNSWYDETGLEWVNPSPNLRSLNEAILYPGTGTIEGTKVSIGRGTPWPFEVVGAPWIDSKAFARALTERKLAGIRIEPFDFTPEVDRRPGSHQVPQADQLCHGIKITVTDRSALDSVGLGLELAAMLQRLYPTEFNLDKIANWNGSRKVIAAIADGTDPRDLPKLYQGDLDRFLATRAHYLLYK